MVLSTMLALAAAAAVMTAAGSAVGYGLDKVKNVVETGDARLTGEQYLAQQFNAQEAEKSRVFSAEQAQMQRDFEERMSNTAYQRAVSDMKAAGLNPYLLASGASPASTPATTVPSSAQANTSYNSKASFMASLGSVANTALLLAGALNRMAPSGSYHGTSIGFTAR